MKTWLSIILSLLVVGSGFSVQTAQAEEKFRVIVERPILGEISSFRFVIENLPFKLQEETLQITFPSSYLLPPELSDQHLEIGENHQVSEVIVKGQHMLVISANLTGLAFLDLTISISAGIANPLTWPNPSVFAVVFVQKDFVVLSQAIHLRHPNNTVYLSSPIAESPSKWFAKPFELSMNSAVADEIYFSINKEKEQRYTQPFIVQEGIHQFNYYGIRRSGARELSAQKTLMVDLTAPKVDLTWPSERYLTNRETIELQFEVKDISPVRIEIQKYGEFLVPESGKLKVSVKLNPGSNTFHYLATDAAYHTTEGSITILLDITPPYLEIFYPKNNDLICTSRIDIVGKAELGSEVWVGETRAQLDRFGNFVFQWVPSIGRNDVRINAFDAAGNETRRDFQFFYFPGRVIEAHIGQNQAKIDGEEKTINPAPFIDRTTSEVYFPLRFVAEALSYKLQWVPEGSYVSLKRGEWEIRLRSLDPIVQVRNKDMIEDIRLQHVATVHQGSTMIPAEFIKRIFGGDIIINASVRQVFIHFCEETTDSLKAR